MSQADRYKSQGNACLQAGQLQEAVELYTKAIALDPSNEVYFSNRAAAYAGMERWREALDDSYEVVTLKPNWVKGWVRRGAAFTGLGQHEEARKAYLKATQLEPGNTQLVEKMEAAEAAVKQHKERRWEDDLLDSDDEQGAPSASASAGGPSSAPQGSSVAGIKRPADSNDAIGAEELRRTKRIKPGPSLLAQLDRSLKDASEDSLRACLSQIAAADEDACQRVLHILEGLNAASSEGSADEGDDDDGGGAAAWLGGQGSSAGRGAGGIRRGRARPGSESD